MMGNTYNILLMGASYGSLLASKLLFGGHKIHLVCLPPEAELINAEGFRVRLPVRGRKEPGGARLAQAAGQGDGRRRRRGQSEGLRPRRPLHAGAAVPLARRARAARRGRQGEGAVHVDHEHAAAALREAHPGPRLCSAAARLHRPDRVGFLRPGVHDAEQPRPAGDPPARGEGQRADGHAADQLQGGKVRQRGSTPRSCASWRRTWRRRASIRPRARSSCR